ncbi:hypothetical protein [Dubosiella newyorkensis]|uniref:hypothetical protein n=1 Tax=Dubosiella newyorkensis TaxID=1862672 RepID=UPI00272AC7C8|nr:hypothetical protein [Dubosiella newyorkensis]
MGLIREEIKNNDEEKVYIYQYILIVTCLLFLPACFQNEKEEIQTNEKASEKIETIKNEKPKNNEGQDPKELESNSDKASIRLPVPEKIQEIDHGN